jgi:transcriptional antiterminator NusG
MPDLTETTESVDVEESAAEETAMVSEGNETEALADIPESADADIPESADAGETVDTMPVEEAAEDPTEESEEEATVESAAETIEVAADGEPEASDEAPIPIPPPASPYDLPGDWYVIHSYSGYENKVKANLETRIQSMHMEDRIFEVHIPMEDVVEFKGGKKVTVPKKVFPGYILVRMSLDDDSWYAVRNTPGVTGFVAGNAQKPTPLSRREVERFLGVQEEEEKGKPRFKPEWDVGEQVRVVTGPFADFNGVIEEINIDQQKIVVLVNIFGRDTPVELGFDDIQKS